MSKPELKLHEVSSVSEPSGEMNEDTLGCRAGQAAWVIDGGTSLTSRSIEGLPPAAWLARVLSSALQNPSSDRNPREQLTAAMNEARLRYNATTDSDELPPSAAISLLHLYKSSAIISSLGDVSVLLLSAGSDAVQVIHGGPRSITETSLETTYLAELKAGISVKDARRRALQEVESRRKLKMNRPGGYWIAGIEPEAAKHAKTYTVALKRYDRILLASDGFMAAEAYGLVDDWRSVITSQISLETLIERIRRIEADDSEGRNFVRLKKSDDATALLLEVL